MNRLTSANVLTFVIATLGLTACAGSADDPAIEADEIAAQAVAAAPQAGADAAQGADDEPAVNAEPDPAGGTLEPILPQVTGACPQFRSGSMTVMGSRATVYAGAKKQGTGSLVFYFYGTGKLGGVSMLPASVRNQITNDGGIVFALQQAKNTGGDCSGTGTWGIDDMKILDQVAACAVQEHGIDPRRIYATGCSAGGLFTGCVGIMRSNYIAAVAPNSGGVTIGYGKLQRKEWMPNAINMHGGGGDNVIVNFGQTSEAYANYVLKWGGFAVDCNHGSGHCGAGAVYPTAWQFLKDHPYGTKPSPWAAGIPSGSHRSCKIAQATERRPFGGFGE
ncbi:MAG: hypothetical protein ABW252_08480 [Polyangiales bacterium]